MGREEVGSDTHLLVNLLVWACVGEGKFSTPSSVFYICISCMSIGDRVGAFAILIIHNCNFYKRTLKKKKSIKTALIFKQRMSDGQGNEKATSA